MKYHKKVILKAALFLACFAPFALLSQNSNGDGQRRWTRNSQPRVAPVPQSQEAIVYDLPVDENGNALEPGNAYAQQQVVYPNNNASSTNFQPNNVAPSNTQTQGQALQAQGQKVPESAPSAYVSRMRPSEDNSPAALLSSLAFNNPFGENKKISEEELAGVSLKSAVMIDGEWAFSMSSKDGKSIWLKIDEPSEIMPCKIIAFDEKSMTAKAVIAGRTFDLTISERPSSGGAGSVELVDAIKPRQQISQNDRAKLWKHASDAQKQAANDIARTAQAAGRRMNREDYRKIREIEQSIKVPAIPQGGASAPAM